MVDPFLCGVKKEIPATLRSPPPSPPQLPPFAVSRAPHPRVLHPVQHEQVTCRDRVQEHESDAEARSRQQEIPDEIEENQVARAEAVSEDDSGIEAVALLEMQDDEQGKQHGGKSAEDSGPFGAEPAGEAGDQDHEQPRRSAAEQQLRHARSPSAGRAGRELEPVHDEQVARHDPRGQGERADEPDPEPADREGEQEVGGNGAEHGGRDLHKPAAVTQRFPDEQIDQAEQHRGRETRDTPGDRFHDEERSLLPCEEKNGDADSQRKAGQDACDGRSRPSGDLGEEKHHRDGDRELDQHAVHAA